MQLLIVGAGPVGLSLALALARRGIAFRQIDQAPAPSAHSKALAIQARTLEALAPLGAAAPILAAALRPAGATFHLDGATAGLTLSQAVHPDFPSVVILPQAVTERLFAEALAGAGAPPPARGTALLALDAGSGAATLRHPDGSTEQARFDHVIGCDGAHSAVRKAAGIAFEGAAYQEQFVLADGQCSGLEPGRLHFFPGRHAAGFCFPLPGGGWRGVAVLPPEALPPAEGDLSPFRFPGVAFRDATWWSAFRISHRIAATFRAGSVLLAGDAAHIHSPAGGQGMNLGIQDACSLALALPQGEAALAAWAAERRAVAAMVVRRTDAMTRAMLGQTAALRRLRAVALRVLPLLPPARRRFERALAGLDYPPIGSGRRPAMPG
jgi:2-polyprenyl-6-methoxyphenol hydroxylase-like FAD-dependent oxidoreductase